MKLMGKAGKTGLQADIENLYLQFLRAFYEDEDRARSLSLAETLEAELGRRPELSESIRGDELRSLIAEARGGLESAIKSRQNEIRKIFELHSLVQGQPGWDYVFKQYDYRDISDRIDILAALYAQMGDHDEAVSLLEESRRFCESHGIPFDGGDLLDESRESRDEGSEADLESSASRKLLDSAIIEVYKSFHQSADEILVDEEKGRRFAAEVLRRLPPDLQVPLKIVKSRLLKLGRRGEHRGGLPRLRHHA